MDKQKYFLILYILAFGYLGNRFTSVVINMDVSLVLTVLWGYVGWIKFKDEDRKQKTLYGFNGILVGITFCLAVSPIVPYLYYEQSYVGTLISQRHNYAFFLLPLLARIRPSERDLFEPMRVCTYTTIVFFIISIFMPDFFKGQEAAEEMIASREMLESTDIGTTVPGLPLATFYFFYRLTVFLNKFTKKDIWESLALMALFIAYQNRSTLIGLLPLMMYVLYKVIKAKKGKAIIIFIGAITIAAPVLFILWRSLVQETGDQLGSDNYPRILAIQYFVFEAKDNMLKILLGNGVWTGNGAYYKLIESWGNNIFVSDIGLLGTFFYYGIIPLLIVYRYVFYGLLSKKIPVYLRYYSLWILIVPTIHTFLILSVPSNLIFALYFYLILYYKNYFYCPLEKIYAKQLC